MVIEALDLPRGASVLVTGAAGAVGGYVIQLARRAGLTVAGVAKQEDVDLVRRLGADEIVPRGDEMGAALRRRWPHGVDGLVDAALMGESAAALVRDGGVAVTLRRSNPIVDPRLVVRHVSVTDRVDDAAALQRLAQLLNDGVLTPRVAVRLPLAEAAQANGLVEQGGLRGRVVLTTGT
jgi:NADPH:quinone reductase